MLIMLTIFLSHNHIDKPFARRLTERLKAHGIKVWLDEAEMQVGDSLLSKIESAIRECTYLGVILSPRSIDIIGFKCCHRSSVNQKLAAGDDKKRGDCASRMQSPSRDPRCLLW
jgi:TIR domain